MTTAADQGCLVITGDQRASRAVRSGIGRRAHQLSRGGSGPTTARGWEPAGRMAPGWPPCETARLAGPGLRQLAVDDDRNITKMACMALNLELDRTSQVPLAR